MLKHSSFINSLGMKESAYLLERKKTQSNTVLWVVLSSHMIILTNKKTALPRARIYLLRHSKIVLLFFLSSHMISLINENTVLLWGKSVFLLSNSYMGVLVRSVRVINLNKPIPLNVWTIKKKIMVQGGYSALWTY